jgi:hypothetical protein
VRDENDDDTMLGKMHDEKNTKECGKDAMIFGGDANI